MLTVILTALRAETRAVAGCGRWHRLGGWPMLQVACGSGTIVCLCAGIGMHRAQSAAWSALRLKPALLVSTGIAAGLSSELAAGSLVAPDVLSADGAGGDSISCSAAEAVRGMLGEHGMAIHGGRGLSCTNPVTGAQEKQRLRSLHAASFCDMESAVAARVAAEAEVPFFSLRAICDPWNEPVPDRLGSCIRKDGAISLLRLAAEALRRPDFFRDVWHLKTNYDLALCSLEAAWAALVRTGMGFLLKDIG